MNLKKILIIGATSSVAIKCASLWAKLFNAEFILIGRNSTKLKLVVQILKEINSDIDAEIHELDFMNFNEIQTKLNLIFEKHVIDIAIICHGHIGEQALCQEKIDENLKILSINGVSPVLFSEIIVKKMSQINYGSLAILGSVAGDVGKKSNYIYSSGKAMVSIYYEGLLHRFSKSNLHIVLLKLGPIDSQMSKNFKGSKILLTELDKAALSIVKAINEGRGIKYIPSFWYVLMYILRSIPMKILHKFDF